MDRYSSTAIADNVLNPEPINEELSISFEIDKGSITKNINDILITTYDVAEARAKAEFLDSSYITKRLQFETYHIDDINIADLIELNGVVYMVQRITTKISGAKVSMLLTCDRWE